MDLTADQIRTYRDDEFLWLEWDTYRATNPADAIATHRWRYG